MLMFWFGWVVGVLSAFLVSVLAVLALVGAALRRSRPGAGQPFGVNKAAGGAAKVG